MSKKIIDWKSGIVTSTGAATETVCATDSIPTGTTVTLEVFLQGRDTVTGSIASTNFIAQAKRVAGVLSLVGSPIVLVSFAAGSDVALAAASALIDVSVDVLRLRATGVALTTIEWFGDMRVRIN